jgi:chromosome partitioning protein
MGKTIAIASRKGGVGKTATAVSLSVGLAQNGKSVLVLDCDPQHSATVSLGIRSADNLPTTLTSVMNAEIDDADYDPAIGIIHNAEGVDILPTNNSLAFVELTLVQSMSRESVLRQYVERVRERYDYVIIDCSPNIGLLTINALAAADSVIIPVCPKYLDALGLEQLLKTVAQIRRQINPKLAVEGILLTMADHRASHTREVVSLVEEAYGNNIRIYSEHIPRSVRVAEASAGGMSIYAHDPRGKVAAACESVVREVLSNG